MEKKTKPPLSLDGVFDDAAYVGIHKNSKGRITLVVNNGDGSVRTSCSQKTLTYAQRICVCRERIKGGGYAGK